MNFIWFDWREGFGCLEGFNSGRYYVAYEASRLCSSGIVIQLELTTQLTFFAAWPLLFKHI